MSLCFRAGRPSVMSGEFDLYLYRPKLKTDYQVACVSHKYNDKEKNQDLLILLYLALFFLFSFNYIITWDITDMLRRKI